LHPFSDLFIFIFDAVAVVMAWLLLQTAAFYLSVDEKVFIVGGSSIPDDVARFVLESVDSVAQLEALLLLRSSPEERWSAQALAARLYIDEKQTARILSDISKQSLALVFIGDPPVYQYQPGSIQLRQVVDRVAEIYAKQLVPITNLIHSKPKTRVQEFADAFKFRKDE
jgi:hypothetical protein